MRKIAFVFPGQGAQSVGMLRELALEYPFLVQTFSEASNVLGYDLWKLVQEGPEEKLNSTEFTQPALLAASIAVWRLWIGKGGIMPTIMAGHSLGEYSALVCAQTIDFPHAVKLVATRGRLMQEAVVEGAGAMGAIVGLPDAKVREICEIAEQGDVVTPANYNAINQIVIAGHATAVERALTLAKEAGAKIAKRIAVSVPSHCALMQPAAKSLAKQLENITFAAPQISVINNVDVTVKSDAFAVKDTLVRQLSNPVRWVETIQLMVKQGVEIIVECGPGKVLAGLNKRINPDIQTISIGDVASFQDALQNVN